MLIVHELFLFIHPIYLLPVCGFFFGIMADKLHKNGGFS